MSSNSQDPADIESLVSMDDRIDMLCDAFEAQWRRNESPRIEAYLARCEPAEQPVLLKELVLLELNLQEQDATASLSSYIARFPKFTGELDAIWLELKHSETLSVGVDATLNKGYAAGERLGHFELLERVGAGAAGEIWKAQDVRLRRIVAVKIPRTQRLSEQELRRFLREGRTAAQLRHNHLVPVYGVESAGETVFIVSAFIEGSNLKERLQHAPPSRDQSAAWCADLAEALHHMHQKGVIHRDLKPANVLIDAQDQVHLTDFGLAKWAEDVHEMTMAGQILGTPAYMSPEQARGDAAVVDQRTDIYALGCILYEMLTGQLPFRGDVAAILNAIRCDEPQSPKTICKELPRDLETICLKAMEKEPRRRYASAQEMAVDLRRYLRGDPIIARRIGLVERGARWVRRRRSLVALIVMALVTAGSFGVAAMFAEKNVQLLGLRTVAIDTNPPGAKVTLVPLSDLTKEPLPDQMVHASMRSPAEVQLRPGHYLVVAELDNGCFHEVFRYVPHAEETIADGITSLYWRLEDGVLHWRPVRIPDQSVTENMALISGIAQSPADTFTPTADQPLRAAVASLPSFYVDFQEFTEDDYVGMHTPEYLRGHRRTVPSDWAMPCGYYQAMMQAESNGKRLPTMEEFQFLATNGGTTPWPWGDDPPPTVDVTEFGPVGTPTFDRLLMDPRVTGLCSNVAEWTQTPGNRGLFPQPVATPDGGTRKPPNHALVIKSQSGGLTQVVGGGDVVVFQGNPTVAAKHRGGVTMTAANRYKRYPGVGFRAVRSARPRNTPEAFRPTTKNP